MRGSRLSEAHRHPPGNADAGAWSGVAGSEAEGGVGGERRSLSRQLGAPTDRQYRRFSDSETKRARMTRRPFFAMDFNRHGHEIAFAPRQERSGGRSWMVGHPEVGQKRRSGRSLPVKAETLRPLADKSAFVAAQKRGRAVQLVCSAHRSEERRIGKEC